MKKRTPPKSIRLPDDLLEKLCQSAKLNKRSWSSEVIHRLLHSFKRGKP